ncbi:MAG: carboxypeptidase-like regulatory domain-containing protein, partial [Pyrinomonadaceae bacterium]
MLPICASAQFNTTSISGRVLDQNSAAISGATVTLRPNNSLSELTVITDENGRFRFEDLVPTEYRLVINQAGFSTSDTVITAPGTGNSAIEVL